MKDNLTELVVVVDKSGSMGSVRNDAIGGFNVFLEAQKKAEGEAKMTVVMFDTTFSFYAANDDVQSVKNFDDTSYVPNGGTALYDAVGKTIDEIGKKLAVMKEDDRPGKVIFAILTDGEENSSHSYSGGLVKKMIELQRDSYKWDFVFLAAGEGAFKEAESMGMLRGKTMKFANSGVNQTKGYENLTSYVTNSRGMNAADYASFSASVDLQSSFDGGGASDLTALADKIKLGPVTIDLIPPKEKKTEAIVTPEAEGPAP